MERKPYSRGRTDQALGIGIRTDADEDALLDRPAPGYSAACPIVLHFRIHAVRSSAQGEFTQGDQVPLSEERANRHARLRRDIDLPSSMREISTSGGRSIK